MKGNLVYQTPASCATCAHWDVVYDDIGVCEQIDLYGYRDAKPVWIGMDNVDDTAVGGLHLRTRADFGCTEWLEENGVSPKTDPIVFEDGPDFDPMHPPIDLLGPGDADAPWFTRKARQ